MEYLDFELPIKELEDQLEKCELIGQESNVDVTNTCKQIEKKLEETKKKIYKKYRYNVGRFFNCTKACIGQRIFSTK